MRKDRTVFILLCVSVLMVLFSSCTDDFNSLNVDPNNPTDVPATTLLTYAMHEGIDQELGAGWMHHTYLSCWSQLYAKIQYIDEDRYLFRGTNINGFWWTDYARHLKDLAIVIEKAQEAEYKDMEAVGRIMKAYFFQRTTDCWGDVPYTEALMGDEGILTPKFDTQQSIYTDLIAEVKAGVAMLADAEGDQLSKCDLIYGGDVDAWRKFGNSLLLRMYMRISGADEATAQAGIQEVVSSGIYIQSNDDNATLAIDGSKPYRNGLMETLDTRTDQGCSKTMIDLLVGMNDPRLPIYAQDIDDDYGKGQFDGPDTIFVGQINGDAGAGPVQSTISLLGVPIAYDADRPYQILSYADVCFILAEAALKGWTAGGSAQSWYEEGIRASCEQWSALAQASPMAGYAPEAAEITAAEIDAYLQEDGVAYDAANAMEQICTQRWMALYPNGVQAFSVFRRTGYPAVIETYELPATTYPGLGVPLRFPYPTDEEARNSTNLAAAKAGIHDDMYGKPVWWDTRTTTASGEPRPGIN
ncbi:SusD/RagB family nutrient-binding outer membrane lipoprotein [bacterium]|nr:SusD/RagB family nutrient-binding outer membrane lipoprotein [bacterium]